MTELNVRHSVRQLQEMHDAGNTQPLDDLIKAWVGIKNLSPDDLNSFFVVGGYHGEPFDGQGEVDPAYWGGYCNHGNVLFPTWHRVYVLRIEQALQSIVPGVMMPYWDETSIETLRLGIPSVLTAEHYLLDGVSINNPLRSYVLQKEVLDNVEGSNHLYTKPKGYETVRYPLSGLVGTEEDRGKTEIHNAKYPNAGENTVLLNNNIHAWLKSGTTEPDEHRQTLSKTGVAYKFYSCLDAPNYTAFSNTTSASAWSGSNAGKSIVPLESPHNDIHLAVGGYDVGGSEVGLVAGANGDMGENNTAGLDPIFFFHHCNIDRMFWLWQVKNGTTDNFDIIPGYSGTNVSEKGSQGPAVGQKKGESLNMDSSLYPFLKDPTNPASLYSSKDCINIETQLGFTYSDGSLAAKDIRPEFGAAKMRNIVSIAGKAQTFKKLEVSGISRTLFRGSFVIRAYAEILNKRHYLGHYSVLSRGNVKNCSNCQNHLDVNAYFDLDEFSDEEIQNATFSIEIQHRGHDGANLPKALNYSLKVID